MAVSVAMAGLCALGAACAGSDTQQDAGSAEPSQAVDVGPSPGSAGDDGAGPAGDGDTAQADNTDNASQAGAAQARDTAQPGAAEQAAPQADDAVPPDDTPQADEPGQAPGPLPLSQMNPDDPGEWGIEVLDVWPHDPTAFTQGLEFHNGAVIESTGGYGASTVRLVDPPSGQVLEQRALDPQLFGEGPTRVGDTVIQLTWKAGTALRWRLPGLEPLAPLAYDGEGWGACTMGGSVITSDGSPTIRRRDPETFEVLAGTEVTLRGRPVEDLNELECIDGLVVANVWHSDHLVVFGPDDGRVLAQIDASGLGEHIERPDDSEAVLNGVADLGDGTLLLTGKLWPASAVVRLTSS